LGHEVVYVYYLFGCKFGCKHHDYNCINHVCKMFYFFKDKTCFIILNKLINITIYFFF